jgi:hypothetical protein
VNEMPHVSRHSAIFTIAEKITKQLGYVYKELEAVRGFIFSEKQNV